MANDVLETVNEMYGNYPSGSAGKEVGYLCPGTCLDYNYDSLNVKYSYAMEIWNAQNADPSFIPKMEP